MPADYLVNLYNTTGTKIAIFDAWTSLTINHGVNNYSTHQFIMNGGDSRIELFTKDCLLEVVRRNQEYSVAWYTEYIGFHRTSQRQITETGRRLFTSYGRGLLDLINRRNILHFASSSGASKTGAAETVIKQFVDENAGPGAVTPPRLRAGALTGLTVQATAGLGATWTGSRAYHNLLEIIADIAGSSGLVFDVVRTGTLTFLFKVYEQEDRTTMGLVPSTGLNAAGNTPIIFAPEFGNMAVPSLTASATEEVTTVVVLGQGQEDNREFVVRQSAAIADSPWNDIEDSHDARQESTVAGLNSQGDEALHDQSAKENFNCNIIQTPSCAYGRDYFLSDLIEARFDTIEREKQIIAITVNVANGEENISIELGDLA